MSLEDEIEKLIRAERDKFEARDQKDRKFYERQVQRFIPMRGIIEEISKSLEQKYIRVSIHESDARIELGRENSSGYFEEDISCQIEPNYEWQEPSKDGFLLYEQAGFRLEEVTYHYPNYGTSEQTYTFDSEQATAEYLVKKIAKKVGFYRHLEAKSNK